MNATYWDIKPGQIAGNEELISGHTSAREAWKALGKRDGRVACLQTIESELPAEDPAYAPFETSRYCVLVRK